MREAEQFFTKALEEAGVDAEVIRQNEPETFSEDFYVVKRLGDEKLTYRVSIPTNDFTDDIRNVHKRLAQEAQQVKRKFDEFMVNTFEWDNGRRVKVSPYDGGWAECCICDTRVDAPKAKYLIQESAELSTPSPVGRDMQHELKRMDGHQEIVFKMYLIGLLRVECEQRCPNCRYTDSSHFRSGASIAGD